MMEPLDGVLLRVCFFSPLPWKEGGKQFIWANLPLIKLKLITFVLGTWEGEVRKHVNHVWHDVKWEILELVGIEIWGDVIDMVSN